MRLRIVFGVVIAALLPVGIDACIGLDRFAYIVVGLFAAMLAVAIIMRNLIRHEEYLEKSGVDLAYEVSSRDRELKNARDKLLQTRKMSAVSSLGAGIAHEINNPLTSVLGLTQLLIRRVEIQADDEAQLQILRDIEKEARRIMTIVRSFQGVAHNYTGISYSRLSVSELFDAAYRVVDDALGLHSRNSINVKRAYDSPMPSVLGNRTQLVGVLSQLMTNSCTAMGSGGSLELSAECLDGELIKLVVEDTGTGIPNEDLEKIFDPFFTTCGGEHKGLGLAEAFRTVEEHNGTIKAQSTIGVGTRITISLPVARGGTHLV